jgi:acyl-CoA thioester hydrolase
VARRRFLLQVRTTDLDWLQHVNNSVYGDYLQEARVDLLSTWRGAGLTHPELSMVVANLEITYRRSIHFRPEPVAIDTWTEKVGRTSYTLAHEIREPGSDVVYAVARSVMVLVDKATERPTPLGDELRDALEAWTDDATTGDATTQDGTAQDGTAQDGTTKDPTTKDPTTKSPTTEDGAIAP